MTRTSRFDFGSGPDTDPAYQWDTKRKLFSVQPGRGMRLLNTVIVMK